MALFKNMVITYAGMALFAKAQAGQEIHFTKMQVGSGQVGTRNPSALTSLIEPKIDIPISSITPNTENKSATIIGNTTNKGLTEAIYICEIGIWAKDPNDGEILYGYANCGTYGDYYAPELQGAYSWQYQISAAIGNAANVTANISELIWDHGVMTSSANFIYLKGANQREINKSIDESIDKLKEEMKDSKLNFFESDVLMKPLTGCIGGFVQLGTDSKPAIQGKTLVNLSKFTSIRYDDINKAYYTNKINSLGISNRIVTIFNPTNKIILVEISTIDGTYKRFIRCTSILTTVQINSDEVILDVSGVTVDGWNDANKAELLKVMVLDEEVKVAPNSYFEGIKHVGELVTLQAKSDTTVTSKQFIDLEVVNAYDMKIGELVKWVDANNTLVRDNIKITNIVGNVLSLDFGSVFETGTIKSIEKLIPKTDHYRIEFISKTENFINYKNYNLVSNMPTNVKFDSDKRWDWDTSGNYGGIIFNAKCPTSICTISLRGDRSRIVVKENGSYLSNSSTSKNGEVVSCSFSSKTGNVSITIENAETGAGHSWFSELMCVLGSTPPSKFIPYVENKTEILSSTPWMQWDSTDKNGVKTIRSREGVLIGTEDWILSPNQPKNKSLTRFHFYKNDVMGGTIDNVISSKFASVSSLDFSIVSSECIFTHSDGREIDILIYNSRLPSNDATGFKTWLSQNNVPIVYKVIDSAVKIENTNKTLILDAYPNGNLQVNCGLVQAHVEGSYSTNTGERIAGAEGAIDALNTRTYNLEKASFVLAGNVVDLNEKTQEFKRVKSGVPVDGKYPILTVKRMDNTIYKISTLSGGTAPLWTTRTVQYYDKSGTVMIGNPIIKTITYDADGNVVSEV